MFGYIKQLLKEVKMYQIVCHSRTLRKYQYEIYGFHFGKFLIIYTGTAKILKDSLPANIKLVMLRGKSDI